MHVLKLVLVGVMSCIICRRSLLPLKNRCGPRSIQLCFALELLLSRTSSISGSPSIRCTHRSSLEMFLGVNTTAFIYIRPVCHAVSSFASQLITEKGCSFPGEWTACSHPLSEAAREETHEDG
ncbi:hypothetical protein BDP27DRAFT_390031 [Rhodocollybia butyracea]|uniref:Secreted protein n=1 Tax=Rhodocollybia butyracea TaxID=206335 RepID=A0A9P5Q3B6_9AGAR|nr:hypothetical protein BDP27DRAFT_390031 [Rhodocollybia butyracea]